MKHTPKSRARIAASVTKTLAKKNARIRRALAVLDLLEKNGIVMLDDVRGLK